MRIVVTGLVATYPMGGVAWDYLTYVDGFHRLGCDVLYLEDTGQWMYDPVRQTFTEDVSVNVRYLSEGLRLLEVPHDAFAVRAPDGTYYGANGQAVERFCRSADLFLNISGSCWLRDEYRGAKRTAYLDSDPGYTQAKLLAKERGYASRDDLFSVDLIHQHDRFFTFAEHMGQPDCLVPACGLRWVPTRQPVVLERWPFHHDPRAERFTTVMSWKTDVAPPMIDGVRYGGKDLEFARFLELPRRARVPLEMAIAGVASGIFAAMVGVPALRLYSGELLIQKLERLFVSLDEEDRIGRSEILPRRVGSTRPSCPPRHAWRASLRRRRTWPY